MAIKSAIALRKLIRVRTAEGPEWKNTDEVFKQEGRVFACLAAFSRLQKNHLPALPRTGRGHQGQGHRTQSRSSAVKRRFRDYEWKKASGAEGKMSSGRRQRRFRKAIEMTLDASGNWPRAALKGYSMLVEDGVSEEVRSQCRGYRWQMPTLGADALLKTL